MSEDIVDALIAHCWPAGDRLDGDQVYMLLDGARDPAIAPLVRYGRLEWTCLYAWQLTPDLQAAAPYIVHLSANSSKTRELLARGWGKIWGILTIVPQQLTRERLRLHFKKLLRVRCVRVRDEAGRCSTSDSTPRPCCAFSCRRARRSSWRHFSIPCTPDRESRRAGVSNGIPFRWRGDTNP